MIFTVTRLQVILDVGVKVSTQAAGSAHELWAELDVNGATASVPGQREAVLLGHQDVLRDLLQLQVVDVMRELQAEHRPCLHQENAAHMRFCIQACSCVLQHAADLWPLKVTLVACSRTSPSHGRKRLTDRWQV